MEHNDPIPISAEHLETLRSEGKPLFDLGRVVGTPAVMAHLAKHAIFPPALLQPHQHGDWGQLGAEDAARNDAAVLHGGRIFSVFLAGGERIYVITEAADDDGVRASTCLMLPQEY